MPAWISKKALELGGEFTREAAGVLRDFIGNNTQGAVQEINKLLAYVNYERPVTVSDVENLSIRDRQSDIFALADALGNRQRKAVELLHNLLEEMDFMPLFGMVVRQPVAHPGSGNPGFGGGEGNITETLGVHPLWQNHAQAQQFDLRSLEEHLSPPAED